MYVPVTVAVEVAVAVRYAALSEASPEMTFQATVEPSGIFATAPVNG
jgi:hypothetical protein